MCRPPSTPQPRYSKRCKPARLIRPWASNRRSMVRGGGQQTSLSSLPVTVTSPDTRSDSGLNCASPLRRRYSSSKTSSMPLLTRYSGLPLHRVPQRPTDFHPKTQRAGIGVADNPMLPSAACLTDARALMRDRAGCQAFSLQQNQACNARRIAPHTRIVEHAQQGPHGQCIPCSTHTAMRAADCDTTSVGRLQFSDGVHQPQQRYLTAKHISRHHAVSAVAPDISGGNGAHRCRPWPRLARWPRRSPPGRACCRRAG